ncbi:MAG: family 10 glycosylhydrolase, partial [Leptolyngbyaceae cyanobacterium bins.302]|nr:family 10 glycosylhydrolase [Leptolyngbyaceae cyanobacterium bins.302]
NASEQMIRDRVRYYRSQGINTIIHGVWGNGCTMYNSDVMQQTFGFKSCPNQFQEQWLDWLIDEAHRQGMQVHAYFEKGIKIDKNSPIFDLAIAKRWVVPGVDKTYAGIDHYVLDVEIPEVARLFKQISVEFVKKYPKVDAVQWDDYLGYHAELPGKVDRTAHLTNFVRQMRADIKKANPRVSFDLCHHNPYWGKRYFAADWQNWSVDRAFIQIYNDANFNQELDYAQTYAGVAISDQQMGRLKTLVNDPKIKSILIFPMTGKPEAAAAMVKKFTLIGN